MEMGIQILSFQRGCERCFYFILYFKLNKYRGKNIQYENEYKNDSSY